MSLNFERKQELLRAIRQVGRRSRGSPACRRPLTEAEIRTRSTPLVVCYGAGVDSTALLIEFIRRGIRPDLILFADVGAEKPETYQIIPLVNAYLQQYGFPEITTVRLSGQKWLNLEHQCLATAQLPSLAFGGHSCSLKWKVEAQQKFVRNWEPALIAWSRGERVIKVIGYDATPADRRRSCRTFLPTASDTDHRWYCFWYPLQEWGLTRDDCVQIIKNAGVGEIGKSACYFCPAAKRQEIVSLFNAHPELFWRAVAMEDGFRNGSHYRPPVANEVGKLEKHTEGLGRNWSWREFYEAGFETPAEKRRRLREQERLPLLCELLRAGPTTAGERLVAITGSDPSARSG